MMPHKSGVCILLFVIVIGCTPFHSQPPAPSSTQPVANQRIRQFERQVVQRALLLEQKGRWIEAEAVFIDGLNVMPNSGLIRTARQRFLQRRSGRQAALDAELALAQGHMLMARADALEEAVRLRGASLKNRLLQAMNNDDRNAMASELTRHGNAAIKRRDWELARDCFSLSMVLSPTAAAARALNRVDRALLARPTLPPPLPPAITTRPPKVATKTKPIQRPRIRKPTASPPEATITSLSDAQRMKIMQMEFERAYSKGQMDAAQHHMAMLLSAFPEDDRISRMADRFNAEISNRIDSDLRRGRRLYSSGDVRGALTIWRRALALAPENEDLRSNVARAERVLENIKALTEKQVK